MIKELVEAARKVEMETFKKHGLYEKVPIEECWKETGKGPVGVKWVDTNMGDKEKPEYRCRLVAKEITGGEEDVVLAVGQRAWFWTSETWFVLTVTRRQEERCTWSC